MVTGQRSGQNQLEDLLRWVISTTERPAPKPEVPDVERLLQKLVRETQSRPPAVIGPPVPTTLEQMLHSFLDGQRQRQRPPQRQRPTRRDWTDVVCFSCRNLRSCNQVGIGRICDDTAAGDDRPPAGEKRQLIREGGSASRVNDHARPRNPGGGTVPTVSPRWTIIDDVSQAVGQSGGGGDLSWSSLGVRQCGLNRLRLRTLRNVSVLMMLLDYDHMMARCGCRMIECL